MAVPRIILRKSESVATLAAQVGSYYQDVVNCDMEGI